MSNWDKKFMDMANLTATWSKDRDRKVGAVIVTDDHRVVSVGYNGFPAGISDDIEERHVKPLKLQYSVHAEANSIYSAAKLGTSIDDCIMYVTFHPCSQCALAIMSVGIKRVVCYEPEVGSSWYQTASIAKQMMEEKGIEVIYFKDEN